MNATFGLVAIPVEIHTAIHDTHVSFNLLHAKCGSRVRNRHLCRVCNVVVERAGAFNKIAGVK
jgi:DNA end-binding protein Ku